MDRRQHRCQSPLSADAVLHIGSQGGSRPQRRVTAEASGTVFARPTGTGSTWLERMIVRSRPTTMCARVRRDRRRVHRLLEMEILRRWFPDKIPRLEDHPFCNNVLSVRARELVELPTTNSSPDSLTCWEAGPVDHRSIEAAPRSCTFSTKRSRTGNRYRREAIAHNGSSASDDVGLRALVLFLANTGRDHLAGGVFFRNASQSPAVPGRPVLGGSNGYLPSGAGPTAYAQEPLLRPHVVIAEGDRLPGDLRRSLLPKVVALADAPLVSLRAGVARTDRELDGAPLLPPHVAQLAELVPDVEVLIDVQPVSVNRSAPSTFPTSLVRSSAS